MRPPYVPPIPWRVWRKDTWEALIDDAFIAKCMWHWDQRKDTYDIAQTLFQSEAAVERAIHIGRERRLKQESNENAATNE